VHDYFDILGVPRNAAAAEIRRACCRRSRSSHPDIWDGEPGHALSPRPVVPGADAHVMVHDLSDIAIDFVEMSPVVDRMLAAFFARVP
jgi:hypothetical protein